MVITAPLAADPCRLLGIEPILVVAAVVFALAAGGLALTPFRSVHAPV